MPPERVVYVVDDDLDVCRSLTLMLRNAGFSTAPYLTAGQLLTEAAGLKPGVVVSDVCMPELDGVALVERWRALGRDDPVILMTGHADVPMAVRAMRSGAFNFIEKPFSHDEIVAAVSEGLNVLGGRSAEDDRSGDRVLGKLSRREREVFAALMDGGTSRSIALELGISPRTVEVHRANVMSKVGARTLPQLIRLGLEAGLDSHRCVT